MIIITIIIIVIIIITSSSFVIIILTLSRSKNPILISYWLPCALHAKKNEIFWCLDCRLAAPVAFFRGSLPSETFERVSVIFDYC